MTTTAEVVDLVTVHPVCRGCDQPFPHQRVRGRQGRNPSWCPTCVETGAREDAWREERRAAHRARLRCIGCGAPSPDADQCGGCVQAVRDLGTLLGLDFDAERRGPESAMVLASGMSSTPNAIRLRDQRIPAGRVFHAAREHGLPVLLRLFHGERTVLAEGPAWDGELVPLRSLLDVRWWA